MKLDVRDEAAVEAAVAAAAERFGGLDALVNNAGALSLTNVENTPPKRYDLIQGVNARAVFVCARAALPYLKRSAHAHVLSLCPPLNFQGDWMGKYAPYTLSKFGMTILSLGMAEEFRAHGIAVNCLWPRTLVATSAVEFSIPGGRALFARARRPEIVADAAAEILLSPARELTGQCLLDETFLRTRGVTDFSGYACDPAGRARCCRTCFWTRHKPVPVRAFSLACALLFWHRSPAMPPLARPPIPPGTDPRLRPFLEASADADADRALAQLMDDAAPIFAALLRRKMRHANGADAEDVASEARTQLVTRLLRLRADPLAHAPIADFPGLRGHGRLHRLGRRSPPPPPRPRDAPQPPALPLGKPHEPGRSRMVDRSRRGTARRFRRLARPIRPSRRPRATSSCAPTRARRRTRRSGAAGTTARRWDWRNRSPDCWRGWVARCRCAN